VEAGTEQLERIAADQPAGLGVAIVEIAGERGQQHVRHEEQAGVDCVARAQFGGGDGSGLL
jgi:hypothetical protein